MKCKVISEKDNVAVLLESEGKIPAGHKIALKDIAEGEEIIKYSNRIGRETQKIRKGEWVHSHNMKTALDETFSYEYHPVHKSFEKNEGYFSGYRRKGRRAGIRNDIFVIPTVGCVNSVAKEIGDSFQGKKIEGIDGVFALSHPYGCSQLGEDHADFRKLLVSVSQNPNAAGVLFVGLGCENNGIGGIREQLQGLPSEHIRFINCQDAEDEVMAGKEKVKELIVRYAAKREKTELGELAIGLKCGGSDGFSGITANPLVGKISDQLVSYGASAVLTEVPEMFGAEQQLMNRCETREVFEKYREMIVGFKRYYTENGFPVYENPSPGNREGGITTLEEKSLGCVEKGGSADIVDVIEYAGRIKRKGLSVLNAPGNDLIASTALAAAGCQIVLFTTGRGTPFATFVPTLKIATNRSLAKKKSNWIDFDAESGNEDELWEKMLKVCSGERCKAEDKREIAYFKRGVTL